MKASTVTTTKKLGKEKPDLEEAIEEEDDADVAEPAEANDDDALDLKSDKYIKQPKAKGGKKVPPKKAAKGDGDDDDDVGGGKAAKGKGKGKAAGGRGKAKK